MVSVDYRQPPDPDACVVHLQGLTLPEHERLVLVGSSMGGYVSTVASRDLQPDALFLMAPAFYLPGYAVQEPVPAAGRVCLVHGWRDSVVPVQHGMRFAQAHRASLHVLDDGHRLQAVLSEVGTLFEALLRRVMAG